LTKFNSSDDIYIGIEAAVEKLNHYYDALSPIIGISLILDPTMKIQYLKDCLKWNEDWINNVLEHFKSAFDYYRQKTNPISSTATEISTTTGFGEFRKKQRLNSQRRQTDTGEEYVRYLI
jgi:phosphosulfolactate synthase (CoM biosynthesis protein A)